ncbi:MAG: hypothetical protein ACLFUJ_07410 [Phycisphaerae bacterium]
MTATTDQPAAVTRTGHAVPGKVCALAETHLGRAPAGTWLATATRVDVGNWLRRARVYLCLDGDTLLLVAAGHDGYCQEASLSCLDESIYNPATGALVLAPAKDLAVRSLEMAPLDARALLERIGSARTARAEDTARKV